MKKIKIVLVEVLKKPMVVEIGNELQDLQELVDGPIELILPFEDDVALICNEEAKNKNLSLNRALYGRNEEIVDIIAGNFFLAYSPVESEELESLSDGLIDKYMNKFEHPECFIVTENGIDVLSVDEN